MLMTRRDILRALTILTAGAAAPGALVACSSDDGRGQDGDDHGVKSELGLVSSDVGRGAGLPEAIPDVVQAMHRFAGGLYGQLSGKPGNLALSPYSIAMALGMTVNGAAGDTATEMRDVLGTGDLDRFNGGMNALDTAIEGLAGKQERQDGSSAELALATANQLFGQGSTPWSEEFLDVLAEEFGAGLRTVDFEGAAEQARTLINDWTAAQTRDRIPEIIPQGVLDALTRLVLVNAIYLKAPWEVPFEKVLTAKRPFHTGDGEAVSVDTMTGNPHAAITTGDGWQAARLLYAGSTVAMTIVLPDAGRVDEVESAVADGGLDRFLEEGSPALLDLRLPRWTFRTQSPLNDVLKTLGMPLAFDEVKADFLPMTADDTQLYISAVLHEAFIAVDEEGTEAAAATAVVISETSAPQYVPFHVDRPFLFVIHDVEHGTPLFLGRVADPLS
jgi:serpin B